MMDASGIYACPVPSPVNSIDILVLNEEPVKGRASLVVSERSPAISFANVLFAFNRSDLSPQAKTQLLGYLPLLKGKHIVLSGHTDSIGSEKYNDKLASMRAETIRAFLISQGLLASNIEAGGEGKCCYVASNESQSTRELNRRVEINTRQGDNN